MSKDNDGNEVGQIFSRRKFIKTSALGIGAAKALTMSSLVAAESPDGAKNMSLNVAGNEFDRTRAIIDRRVKIDGCTLQYTEAAIGDINTHIFSGPQSYDVCEVGLHPFMLAYANDGFRDYSLLPIFLLRLFRHKSVFIRTDRGINTPQDLKGKTIATPGYSSTSLVWIRGILQEEYGIRPEDVNWIVSSKDSSAKLSGKASKQENVFPDGLQINMGPAGLDESDLLVSGEADALFHAVEPRAYTEGHPMVARLFSDYRSTERAYFAKTGIFPIMHAMAIKKSVAEENPWLIDAVFKAYSQSKQIAFKYMANAAWVRDSLPWFGQEFDETRELMGDNYYSYGIDGNRKTLEAMFRYSHQQGLSSRELSIEEIFDPASLKLTESSS